MIGKTIGNCKITDKIGVGGFGTVYKGIQISLNREVAIKALHLQFTEMPGFVEKFKSEAKILATLNHQNIVQVYDILNEEGTYFIIMEYVKGEPLKTLLDRKKRFPVDEAVKIAKDIGNALRYTHSKNIIHRDIKPANIIVTEEGACKVTDFGIAKVLTEVTASFTRVGTLIYAAPEQINGEPIDTRCDIYALGATLYHMLSGAIPPANQPPLLLSSLNASIPAILDKIVIKAMQKKKENRYATMEDFLKDLETAALRAPVDGIMGSTKEEKTVFMQRREATYKNLLLNSAEIFQTIKNKPVLIAAIALLGIAISVIAVSPLFKKPSLPILEEIAKEPVKKEAASVKPSILEQDAVLSKEYFQQGLEHTAKEEWIEAIKDFEETVRYDKKNDRAYYELGYAYSQLSGRNNEVELNMKRAIELNPQNIMYRYSLGLVYLNSGKKSMAVKEWEKAMEIDPQNPNIQAVLKKYKP